MCEEGLSRYPTTLEEDIEILQRENLTFNERNCTLFRSGEKEILVFLIEMADYVLALLEMKFKDAKKRTQTLPAKMESCRDYLQNYVIRLLSNEPAAGNNTTATTTTNWEWVSERVAWVKR